MYFSNFHFVQQFILRGMLCTKSKTFFIIVHVNIYNCFAIKRTDFYISLNTQLNSVMCISPQNVRKTILLTNFDQ